MALEASTEETNQGLVAASQSGDAEAIKRLSKQSHEAQGNSERLYAALESASTKHDRLEAEYSHSLRES